MNYHVAHELRMTLEALRDAAHRHDLLAFSPHDRQERALVGYNRGVERQLLQLAESLEAEARANGILPNGGA